jgi:hypothetical protein
MIFLPTLFYALALAGVIIYGVRRNWPSWAPYLVSVVLTTIVFFAFVSLSSRPIPDIAMYFVQEAPSVRRPAISASEAPLLVISIVAGLLGAWVCASVVRYGFGQKVAQQAVGD